MIDLEKIIKEMSPDELRALDYQVSDMAQWPGCEAHGLHSASEAVRESAQNSMRKAVLLHDLISRQLNGNSEVANLAAAMLPRDHRHIVQCKFDWLLRCLKALEAELDNDRYDLRSVSAVWASKLLMKAYYAIDWTKRPQAF